jgi:hypothetical protein
MNDAGTVDTELEQERSSAPDEPGFLLTGFAWFGGVTLWLLHEGAGVALVPAACSQGLTWLINVLTAVTLAGTLLAIVATEHIRRRYLTGEGLHYGRLHLIVATAYFFNLISFALILLEGYPVWVLDACAR